MIRILLYTPDPKLPLLLTSALKPECRITVECQIDRLKHAASKGDADILVLDLDTNYSSLPEQFAFYEDIMDCPIPVVVMTDALNQSTAMEFMQRGAFDCIRKPPSLVEFKVIVRRAH